MGLDQVHIIEIPEISDDRGHLNFAEGGRHVPFEIKRVFCLYGIPPGKVRGGHAHKWHDEVIFSLVGRFDIRVDDGFRKADFTLDRPNRGLFLPHQVWQDFTHFSPDAVCMVLASDVYTEADYYRKYDEFLQAVRKGPHA